MKSQLFSIRSLAKEAWHLFKDHALMLVGVTVFVLGFSGFFLQVQEVANEKFGIFLRIVVFIFTLVAQMVRVIHIPTNIAVHVATERQQEQNKQKALEILASKLFTREEEKRKAEVEGRQISKTTEIEWGNQIRSYVLHPYKMVKDHRTECETSNVEAVLEKGEIDAFIDAEKNL
jgi:hypothetical protein